MARRHRAPVIRSTRQNVHTGQLAACRWTELREVQSGGGSEARLTSIALPSGRGGRWIPPIYLMNFFWQLTQKMPPLNRDAFARQ